MSPKGRHAKSKARINDYEKMVATESEKRSEDLEIFIPPGERLGDVVIEAHKVSKVVRRQTAFRESGILAAAGRHRRRDRSERCG